jgi:hypothetical protein
MPTLGAEKFDYIVGIEGIHLIQKGQIIGFNIASLFEDYLKTYNQFLLIVNPDYILEI